MAKALVTGSTGFVGSNLVLAFNKRGIEVRALQRKTSPQDAISGLEYEPVIGDLMDVDSLAAAVEGVDWVFHLAGISDWRHTPADVVYRVNVDGARNMMEAAKRAGVKRFVLTSSSSALGKPPPGRDLIDENDAFNLKPEEFAYGHSKYLAELEAEKFAHEGLHVVMVLPTAVMGPRDLKFISGELIIQVLKRGIPGVPPGGLNYIDVRDLAEAHIAAAENGRSGEKYILGGNNMTHRESIDIIAMAVGAKAPAIDIPRWAIPPMAVLFDVLKTVGVKLPGNVDGDSVRLSKEFLYYDTGKAHRDLGLKTRPFEESVRDAYEWYKENGYLEKAGVKAIA